MQGPVIGTFILQAVFCTISGLSLYPSSDLILQSFSIVCNFDGANWTSLVQFFSDGRSAGGCIQPPSLTCFSTIGNMTRQGTQSVTLTLNNASNILTYGTALWQCTHAGLPTGEYNASVIALCSDGQAKQNGDEVDIRCSCGFPDVKATLKYKVSNLQEGPNIVELQNSTGNCVGDSRATDYIYRDNIPIGATELCVSFTTLSQISESKEECININCKDPLLYGLLPVIFIVFFVSVIISFIMKIKSPVKIYEKFQDFSTGKIGIIILITVVAIGIGLALGFGLRNGTGKCDNWGIALGLSIFFGVLLSCILIITIYCISKKENEDDRSPASASKVKVQTGKISQNKPTEKVKEETKPRPLPETPKGRKDQLEPIKLDDGEVENSEQKKKKKKKKKKKEPTEVEKTELQE